MRKLKSCRAELDGSVNNNYIFDPPQLGDPSTDFHET